jgi:hypothetical protein
MNEVSLKSCLLSLIFITTFLYYIGEVLSAECVSSIVAITNHRT